MEILIQLSIREMITIILLILLTSHEKERGGIRSFQNTQELVPMYKENQTVEEIITLQFFCSVFNELHSVENTEWLPVKVFAAQEFIYGYLINFCC